MPSPNSPFDLTSIASARQMYYGDVHKEMEELLDLKENGVLPARFDEFFAPGMHRHAAELITGSWDDTADRATKNFTLFVPPRNETAKAKQEAEKVEVINGGYQDAGAVCGGVPFSYLLRLVMSDIVGLSDAVVAVMPNYDYKTPYFVHKAPHTHLPPIGWGPWKDGHLEGTMFLYQEPMAALKLRYPDKASDLDVAYNKKRFLSKWFNRNFDADASMLLVCEYYHSDAWYVATLEAATSDKAVVLLRSETGDKGHPGVCPIVPMTQPAHTRPKGRSRYAGTMSLEAALARMLSMKIDAFEMGLTGELFISEPEGDIERGPGAVNVLRSIGGQRPFVQKIAPENPVDADQTIGMITGLARSLNRDSELLHGDVDSAKALAEQMNRGIHNTIQQGIWPIVTQVGMPRLHALAMQIDMNCFGNDRKTRAETHFEVDYTPNVALKGYTNRVKVEAGIGLAGYQGTIELLQRYQAGVISLDTLLAQLPDVRGKGQAEKRRIQSDKTEAVMFSIFEQKAAAGLIDMGGLATLNQRVQNGEDFFDVIVELNNAGQLEIQPPTPEAAPGVPPELAGLMGGAPEQMGPPPSMATMRRGL